MIDVIYILTCSSYLILNTVFKSLLYIRHISSDWFLYGWKKNADTWYDKSINESLMHTCHMHMNSWNAFRCGRNRGSELRRMETEWCPQSTAAHLCWNALNGFHHSQDSLSTDLAFGVKIWQKGKTLLPASYLEHSFAGFSMHLFEGFWIFRKG